MCCELHLFLGLLWQNYKNYLGHMAFLKGGYKFTNCEIIVGKKFYLYFYLEKLPFWII